MDAIPSKVSTNSGKDLDTVRLTTSAGVVEREGVFIGSPSDPDLRAEVTASGLSVDNDVLREIATILLRVSRLMESQQVVDQQQRQKICIDAITTALTLTTVTTVGAVTSVTGQAGFLGMDREFFINEARKTFNTGVRANLNWA